MIRLFFIKNKLKKENPSFDEIYSYSYNSQKSFDLKEKENSYMVVDGQKKKLSDLVISKYKIVKGTEKLTITPEAMNESYYFFIGTSKTNGIKRHLQT